MVNNTIKMNIVLYLIEEENDQIIIIGALYGKQKYENLL